MTLSKERLEQFIRQPLENGLTRGEVMQLAKMMINQDEWNAAQQKVIDDLRVQLGRRERDKQEPVSLGLLSVQQARPLTSGRQMHSADNCDDCSHYRSDICHGDKCAAPPESTISNTADIAIDEILKGGQP